jgi:phenylalanyl-tRNA synthetase beta chain
MKISRNWIQTFFDAPLVDAEKLGDALTFHVFEIDGIEKVGDDDVLDVKITANRGHDGLSHRGIAKELSAILNIPLTIDPFRQHISLEPKTDSVSVTIQEPTLCARYIAGYLKGVKVGPSPDWLKKSLEAIGQRSINNVVDATNYVMFGLGQPLHAFDAGKLAARSGNYAISIRRATDGEKIMALDEKEYSLSNSMLVIVDVNGAHSQDGDAIGIAGVKGGMPASITETTKDIVIESANFNGASVRKTAQGLKLRTDASARFEQVISPELAAYGMSAVVELIQKLAGGELVGFVDEYPVPQKDCQVSVSLSRINAVLGTKLSVANVTDVFKRLDLQFSQEGEVFIVTSPFERLDLAIPEDLIEEVGRIVGYDRIPDVELPPPVQPPNLNPNFYAAEKIREELMSQGYSEVLTSVFTEKGERVVANKVDGVRPYLRSNLTEGLAEAVKKNIPNKDLLGLKEIKLFEIGTIWHTDNEEVVFATASEKGTPTQKPLEPNITSSRYDDLSLSAVVRYEAFSKYPYIVRDIAMWTPAGTDASSVLNLIKENGSELLLRCEKFDEFTKGDKTSYAFRLIFQSFDKTLTDVEVNAIMEKISTTLKGRGFEIR